MSTRLARRRNGVGSGAGVVVLSTLFLVPMFVFAGAGAVGNLVPVPWQSQGTPVWVAAYDTGQGEIEVKQSFDPEDLDLQSWPTPVGVVPWKDGIAVLSRTFFTNPETRILYVDQEGELTGFTEIPHRSTTDIGLDSANNLLVSGDSLARETYLMKLSPDGTVEWNVGFQSGDRLYPFARTKFDLDGQDNAYMTFTTETSTYYPPCDREAFATDLVRVTPSGEVTRVTIDADPGDWITDIAVSDDGVVYLAGRHCQIVPVDLLGTLVVDGTLVYRPLLLKLNSSGEILQREVFWDWHHGNPFRIRVDPADRIWVSGQDRTTVAQEDTGFGSGLDCPHLLKHPTCAQYGFVAQFSMDLEPIWMIHPVIGHQTWIGGFDFHPDGGIVVSGQVDQDVYTSDALGPTRWVATQQTILAHVTDEGTIAWIRAFDSGSANSTEALRGDDGVGRTTGGFIAVNGDAVWSAGWDRVRSSTGGAQNNLFIARAPLESEHAHITGPLATLVTQAHKTLREVGAE